jgi:hypothetical protein
MCNKSPPFLANALQASAHSLKLIKSNPKPYQASSPFPPLRSCCKQSHPPSLPPPHPHPPGLTVLQQAHEDTILLCPKWWVFSNPLQECKDQSGNSFSFKISSMQQQPIHPNSSSLLQLRLLTYTTAPLVVPLLLSTSQKPKSQLL